VTEPAFSQEPTPQVTAEEPQARSASIYFVTLVGLLVAFPTIIPTTKANIQRILYHIVTLLWRITSLFSRLLYALKFKTRIRIGTNIPYQSPVVRELITERIFMMMVNTIKHL